MPKTVEDLDRFGGFLSKSPIQIPEVIRSFEQLQYMSVYVSIETRGLGDHPVLRNPLMGLLGYIGIVMSQYYMCAKQCQAV